MVILRKDQTLLEENLTKAQTALLTEEVGSEKYGQILDQIAKLHKMKQDERASKVSADTWALIGTNLAGILMIINHERVNVISSNAMSFVMRAR